MNRLIYASLALVFSTAACDRAGLSRSGDQGGANDDDGGALRLDSGSLPPGTDASILAPDAFIGGLDAASLEDATPAPDAAPQADATPPGADASAAPDATPMVSDASGCERWSPFMPPCDQDAQPAPDAEPPDTGSELDASVGGGDGGPIAGCTGVGSLQMLYGNGLAVLANNWEDGDMAVRVTCNGAPLANATVHWSVTQGHGEISLDMNQPPWVMLDVPTDMNGISKVTFKFGPLINNLASNEPGMVNAAIGAQSIDFFVTAFNPGMSFPTPPQAQLLVPDSAGRDLGSGRAGTIMTMAVHVTVYNATGWDQGRPVANVGVSLVDDQNPPMQGVAWCIGQGNTVLTDATGSAWCDVQLGTMPISGRYLRVMVGNTRYWNGVNVDITP
jgi:hypothetical protein